MPDFWEVLKKRHCAREFDSKKEVEDEKVEKILEAAKMAPSAGDMRDWHFEVVKDSDKKIKIAQAALGQMFIAEAPVVIVVCSDLKIAEEHYEERGVNLYSIQDAAAACQNLFLACTALDLSACWVGAFDEREVRNVLEIPENVRPLIIVPVGYIR